MKYCAAITKDGLDVIHPRYKIGTIGTIGTKIIHNYYLNNYHRNYTYCAYSKYCYN